MHVLLSCCVYGGGGGGGGGVFHLATGPQAYA